MKNTKLKEEKKETFQDILDLAAKNAGYQLSKFIEYENTKEEYFCKEVQNFLEKVFDAQKKNGMKKFLKEFLYYSSGRKRGVFDEWGYWYECYVNKKGWYEEKKVVFSEGEIENYAKAYRLVRMDELFQEPELENISLYRLVKIYDLKIDKI